MFHKTPCLYCSNTLNVQATKLNGGGLVQRLEGCSENLLNQGLHNHCPFHHTSLENFELWMGWTGQQDVNMSAIIIYTEKYCPSNSYTWINSFSQ